MKDDASRLTRERNRAKAIEQSLITTPNDPVVTADVPIGRLPDDVAKRLADDIGLGQVSADLSHVFAKYGAQFDSAAVLNAAAGSSLLNSAEMTKKLIQISSFIEDRESALIFVPLLTDLSATLNKVNLGLAKQKVDIAKTNNGYKAIQSKMFTPRPSFTPGQQIKVVENNPA